MIRFLLMAVSAAGVVWVAAGSEPSDLRSAAGRAAHWVQELPERAHFRSPLADRPGPEAPPAIEMAREEKPAPEPGPTPPPPGLPAEAQAVEERGIDVARAPLTESIPASLDARSEVSVRRPLSTTEAERVRSRLDRVMDLASGQAP